MAAWYEESIPADLTYEAEPGKQAPVREHPFVKDTPDYPTFIKRALDAHREVGTRIPVRIDRSNPTAVESWRKEHLPKLIDAGILPKPITDPAEYGIKKPDDLHEGVNWSDERAGKFAQIGVKYQIPKEAMNEMLEMHREAIAGTAAVLKTSYDDTMLALKREHGDKFDERMEMAKRFNNLIFKTPEEIAFMEETGLGNHPLLASILMRLAPYAENDTSLVEDLKAEGNQQQSGESLEQAREKIRAELADIYSNPQNPRHEAYKRGDAAVEAYIQSLYTKIYGAPKEEAVP